VNNFKLETDMADAIRRSLPQQVSDDLKIFIDEANERIVYTKDLRENLNKTEDRLERALKELSQHTSLATQQGINKKANEALAERDALVTEREDRQELLLLRKELELMKCYEVRSDGFLTKVFGHPNVTITQSKVESAKIIPESSYTTSSTEINTETTVEGKE